MNKKEKCSKSQQNRIVIHKGDSEKRVYQEELNYWLSEGWAKGWSDKHRQTYCKSKIGKTIKGSLKSEETRNKISKSLKEGYSSGKIKPWNSGLDMSDDRVRLIAQDIIDHHNTKTHNKKYNALFTVSSIPLLIKYYDMFKSLNHDLKIGAIFTYGANEDLDKNP